MATEPGRLPKGPAQAALIELQKQLAGSAIPERAEVFGFPALTNGAAVHGMAMTGGYNPLLYARYAEMFSPGTHPLAQPALRTFTPLAPAFDAPAFDLLGLRMIFSPTAFAGAQDIGNGVFAMRRESVVPRIISPVEIQWHAADLPASSSFNATNFSKTVWLPQADAPALASAGCSANASGQAVIKQAVIKQVHYRAGAIRVDYLADRPALLVVNEIHAPGWIAEVQGQRRPLHFANGIFRGVCVPAGEHRLLLEFSPWRMIGLGWQALLQQPATKQ